MKKIEIESGYPYYETIKKFEEDLKNVIQSSKTITTNVHIGSCIQDMGSFTSAKLIPSLQLDESSKAKVYSIGNYGDIEVFINPYMSWGNNRIILDNGEEIIIGGDVDSLI